MEYTATEFTPWLGVAGGALIGLASVLMLVALGRVAGVSGIAAGVMSSNFHEVAWRALFLLGLVLGGLLYAPLTGEPLGVDFPGGLAWMAAGGFLVGFGTRMGSGCTAGHGICGLARLSVRSLVATLTFFITAMITVFILRHLLA